MGEFALATKRWLVRNIENQKLAIAYECAAVRRRTVQRSRLIVVRQLQFGAVA